MAQINPLQYRPNACPLCLTCLICTEVYGKNCICPPKELKWQRKSSEYKIDFRHKYLIWLRPENKKIKLDNVFVDWFYSNISPDLEISEDQHDANVCRKSLNQPRKIKSRSDWLPILSKELPKTWRKIEIGFYSYQLSK
ncbi:2932_t:CDS:2, partial [Funneliformis mosseae]